MDTTPRKQSVAKWFVRTYLGRIIIALVLIVVVQAGYIWLFLLQPQLREQRIAEMVQSLGGSIELHQFRPDLIPHWVPRFIQEELPNWEPIKRVEFQDTEVSDDGLKHLKGLKRLEFLQLDQTRVGDAGLVHLKEMTGLQTLVLDNTNVTDAGLKNLKGLTNLQFLYLDETLVSDVGMECLEGLTKLEYLSLDKTQTTRTRLRPITDTGLEYLKGMTRLERLCLDGNRTTKKGREMLRNALPKCEVIPIP